MQIYITLPNGKTVLIDVQVDKTTVLDVKRKIMEKQGIAFENQILMFQTQILQNDKKLNHYQIDKEAKLELESIQSFAERYMNQISMKFLILEEMKDEQNRLKEQLILQKEKSKQQHDEMAERLEETDKLKNKYEQELKEKELESGNLKNRLQHAETMQQSTIKEGLMKTNTFDQTHQLELKIADLNNQLQIQELDKIEKGHLLEYLKQDKKDLSQKLEQMQKYKDDLMEKTFEVKSLQKEVQYLTERGQSTTGDLERDLNVAKETIKKHEQTINQYQLKNQELELDKVKMEYSKSIDMSSSQRMFQQQDQLQSYETRIAEYKTQIQSLNQQIANLQENQSKNQKDMLSSFSDTNNRKAQEQIFELESQLSKVKAELTAKSQAYEEIQIKLSDLRKQAFENSRKEKELEQSVDNLKQMLREKDKKVKEKEHQLSLVAQEQDYLKKDLLLYQQQNHNLDKLAKQINPSQMVEIDNSLLKNEELIKKREEQRRKDEKEAQERQERENQKRYSEIQQEQKQMEELMKQDKQQRKKTAQFLKKQMMETHGKIEVCFLIDVTASMDPYKEQAMKCITESMKSIKIKTNRDALWAAIAYQDFGELKQLGGLYKQHNFTANPTEVQNFLNDQPCVGGGDYAEDVRGGIMQMIKNLTWSKTFKIALLICDAPTHGKRYNAGVSDRYPNEDIEDAIKLLIEHNILFVAILFNKITLTMFEEIKKIYQSHDREELLIFADLANTEEGKIWQELVDLVSQASQRATQTNNKGTRSKQPQANKNSQAGAMEALCKTIKNPFEFEKHPGVKTVQTHFQVYRVGIKQDSFEANIENINKLDISKDYSINQEGQWNCLRTEKFFAEGQMKQVFLMKRQNNQEELYVIKMPLGDKTYTTLDNAIYECRSHLISKCLMRKFIRELQDARDKKDRSLRFPEPQYSDFLILQDQPSSFWIAERYFKGDFVKYNNNYGFISDDNEPINHLAQAFTYYTYFISNFTYMVSDIQGVGLFFTDPALNTKNGNYDDTDMGLDGQSMFMVSYEGKKHIGQQFLDLLNIKLE